MSPDTILSRRDFLKLSGVVSASLFVRYGITALGKKFQRYIEQSSQTEGSEGASDHKLSLFVSDPDTQGGLVILDETAGALFAITGQPRIGLDSQVDGSYAYFLEEGVQYITGEVKDKNTLNEAYIFDEESRQPRQSKNRTRANVGETIIRISPDNVAITPEAITKGKVGTTQYQKQLMENEQLINNLPQKFSEYGYTLVESPISGTILGSAMLTETTNTKNETSNLLVKFYVRAWRLDENGNKIYNFLPVGKGGIRLNKLTHPLVPNGLAFEPIAGGGIKVAALNFIPELSTPTPEAPKYPAIPQEIMDKLPPKWEAVQTAGTWYIVDSANQTNIYRFPEAAEKWQERHDVTVGETTYEGWIKEEGSKEVETGQASRMEKMRTGISEYQRQYLTILPGYVIKYKTIEITDGMDKMDLIRFTMRYFFEKGGFLDATFQGNSRFVEYNVTAQQALGNSYYLRVSTPVGSVFTSEYLERVTSINSFNALEMKVMFESSSWINLDSLIQKLQQPSQEALNLTHGLLTEDLTK